MPFRVETIRDQAASGARRMESFTTARLSLPARLALITAGLVALVLVLIIAVPALVVFIVVGLILSAWNALTGSLRSLGGASRQDDAGRENVRVIVRDQSDAA